MGAQRARRSRHQLCQFGPVQGRPRGDPDAGKRHRAAAPDQARGGLSRTRSRGGRDFWQVMVERYGLSLDVVGGSLDNIPRDGPLIVIANHPYGILDGLMMGHILSRVRGDFRILANPRVSQGRGAEPDRPADLVRRHQRGGAPEHGDPQDRAGLSGRGRGDRGVSGRHGVDGAHAVFAAAGSGVAHVHRQDDRANRTPPSCRSFSMARTRRLFQIASHLHTTLAAGAADQGIPRAGRRAGAGGRRPADPAARIWPRGANDPKSMMDFLRQQTYALSPRPLKSTGYGFEFEERAQGCRRWQLAFSIPGWAG